MMILNKTSKKRRINIDASAPVTSPFSPPPCLFEDLILFSVSSERFPHFSPDDISILGGSKSVNDLAGQSLFSLVHMSDNDTDFLFSIIYKPENIAAIFPFGRKTLLISTHLLRAGGPGVAIILNFAPSCASAIAISELSDTLCGLLFSPSIEAHTPDDEKCMELYRSVSHFISIISSDARTLLDIIRAAAELASIKVSAELSLDLDGGKDFDSNAVLSLLLCLFSHAGSSGIEKVSLSISNEHNPCVSVEIAATLPISSELLYCEKIAENMGIFFNFNSCQGSYNATFIPKRRAPAEGFKSGIFVNGKRFVNPFI